MPRNLCKNQFAISLIHSSESFHKMRYLGFPAPAEEVVFAAYKKWMNVSFFNVPNEIVEKSQKN